MVARHRSEGMDAMGWLLAALSGIIAGITYPTVFGGFHLPDLGCLGLICWVPLFQVVRGMTPRQAFWRAFFASLFHYGISLYWLYTAMHSYGGLSPAASVGVLLFLVCLLSAYFAVIFLASQWLMRKFHWNSIWVRPFFWIALEFCRDHMPANGFPWSQVGYSQGNFLTFIQSADLGGVYLVTFLVVLCNEWLSEVVTKIRDQKSWAWSLSFYLAPLLLALNLVYGAWVLHSAGPAPFRNLKVGIVQGNIPQDEKWQNDAVPKIIETFHAGTLELQQQGAQLVLWPEASWPIDLFFDMPRVPASLQWSKTDLLIGAITRSQFSVPKKGESMYRNTALLIEPEGEILDFYHKMHLVPLGEYVPYKKLLSFAGKLTQHVGELLPGEEARPIRFHEDYLGTLICYEDIFPEIAREMTAGGAQALVNLTNDAWYGHSSAAYQHVVFSQFRSIETRRSLLRATNTGISSSIDRWGHILWQGPMDEEKLFLSDLPFYRDLSLYVRLGDSFAILAICLSGFGLILGYFFKPNFRSRHV